MITKERATELFDYTQSTGVLTWRVNKARAKAGDVAGTLNSNGYLKTKVDGKNHQTHRIIWVHQFGYNPPSDIDHINQIKTDNRIDNLREVSRSGNVINYNKRNDNNSGVRGIAYIKKNNTWQTYINFNGKVKYIGCSKDFTEAVAMRLAAEQCLGWERFNDSSSASNFISEYINNGKNKRTL